MGFTSTTTSVTPASLPLPQRPLHRPIRFPPMNGLQSVSVSLGKRVRCLPICPPGTPGRTLSRRLAHAAQVESSVLSDKGHRHPAQLDPAIVRRMAKEAAAAVHQVQDLYRGAKQNMAQGTAVPSHTLAPLDEAITGLTPISRPDINSPVGALLKAMDDQRPMAMIEQFRVLKQHLLTRSLTPHQLSHLLLSIRPKKFVNTRARFSIDGRGEAEILKRDAGYAALKQDLYEVTLAMKLDRLRLSALEFTHLIDCSRAGYDVRMADEQWNLMCGNGLIPDTWTYNAHMAAVTGNGASVERYVRASPKTLEHRTKANREDIGMRAQRIVNAMLKRSIPPNNMTYDLLIIASGKLGNLKKVRQILHDVWGVDVDTLPNQDALDKKDLGLKTDSPLYPTIHTLLAAATAFCQNKEIDTAIRVIDHMSQLYSIPISQATWVTILNWSYVYSRQQLGGDGRIPASAVEILWKIMTSEPYNVTPTLEMYDYAVRSLIWRQMPENAEDLMDEAFVRISNEIVRTSGDIQELMKFGQALRGKSPKLTMEKYTADEISFYMKRVSKLVLLERRMRSQMRRWAELLVIGKGNRYRSFSDRRVPDIINKWGIYLGDDLVYLTPTGLVEMSLGKEDVERLPEHRTKRYKLLMLGSGVKEEDDFF